jgi:hypothetical protein
MKVNNIIRIIDYLYKLFNNNKYFIILTVFIDLELNNYFTSNVSLKLF